jgi:hypothetical protein
MVGATRHPFQALLWSPDTQRLITDLTFCYLFWFLVSTVDWTNSRHDKPPWCYAPVTFHHMTAPDIRTIWRFEHDWLQHKDADKPPLLRDIFESLVQPWLQSELPAWDNQSRGTEYSKEALAKLSDADRAAMSQTERNAQASFERCRATCESKSSCIQFFYIPGRCFISNELRWGHSVEPQCVEYSYVEGKCVRMRDTGGSDAVPDIASSAKSGWVTNRVLKATEEMNNKC